MTTESILQSKAKNLHRVLSYYSFKFVKKIPNCDERLMEAKDMLSKSYFTRLYNEEIFMYKIESLLVSFCRSSTRILWATPKLNTTYGYCSVAVIFGSDWKIVWDEVG